jgi:transcriptional regulator with XRE-family HTH domain
VHHALLRSCIVHNDNAWLTYLAALTDPAAPAIRQTDIAKAAGVDNGTVSRWVSGKNHPKAEQVIRVARAYNVSPLGALVAAGYLQQDEIEGEVTVPRALGLSEFTELELAQEMLRRVDRGDSEVLDQPVTVDHPAWSGVGGAAQDDVESLRHAAKTDARELEEDDHTP